MPARVRDIERVARQFNVELEESRGGGSHWKFKRRGDRCYPIPCSNGRKTELSDHYIRGLCRNFGIDFDEMMRRLGS